MHRSVRRALVGVVSAIAVGTLAACGGGASSEKTIEQVLAREGVDADVDIDDDGNVSVASPEGRVTTSARVPDSWPADIPLPDGLEVTVGGEVGNADGSVISVSGLTSASVDELEAMYAAALSGWTEVGRFTAGDSTNIGYQLGERALQISLAASDGQTTLTLSHVLEAQDADGDEAVTETETPADEAVTETETPADEATDAGGDLASGLDQVGLESKGSAIVMAAGAERFEIDGSTIHVYFGDDASLPAGIECMIVTSVLSDGESAVVHRAGTETPC